MQPASKKIKLDWPALVQDYPDSANIFCGDSDAQFEAYKILQTVPKLRNHAIAILQAEMQEPFAGMDEYLLNDANPSLESCTLLFVKCTLHKQDALMQLLQKHQHRYDILVTITEAFEFPIIKWSETLVALLTAILQKYPKFMKEIRKLIDQSSIGPELPKLLLQWLPLVRDSNNTFYWWANSAINVIFGNEQEFDHVMDELVNQLSNRVCIGNKAVMTIYFHMLELEWRILHYRINVQEAVVRALFFCFDDNQKHIYLQESLKSDEIDESPNIESFAELVIEHASLEKLKFNIGSAITNLYLPKIIEFCYNHSEHLHLLVRALCVHNSSIEMQETVLKRIALVSDFTVSFKLDLCLVDWGKQLDLQNLHSSAVQWLNDMHGKQNIPLLYVK